MHDAVASTEPQDSDALTPSSRAEVAATDPVTSAVPTPQEPLWSTHTLLWAIFLLALMAVVFVSRTLLFPIVMAVFLALLLMPAVAGLRRLRIIEPIGAAIVIALTLGAVGGLFVYLQEPAAKWIGEGPQKLRGLENKVRELIRPVTAVTGATERVAEIASGGDEKKAKEVVVERPSLSPMLGTAQALVAGVGSTLVLLYFLLASGDLFLRKLIRVVPGLRDKIRAVEIARGVQQHIGRYFVATVLISIAHGVVTTIAMYFVGLPTPALFGAVAGVLNFLPYVGPLITLIFILIASVVAFDTLWQIALPGLIYVVIASLDGEIAQPFAYGATVRVNTVVLFVWVLLWAWLWGIAGLLVAVPILVALRICAEHIPALATWAEFLSPD